MSSWSRRAAGAAAITAALLAATTPGAQAQEPALNWDNYDPVTLTTDVAEPIDLAVMPDLKVLHTARNGQIRLTDPVAGTTKVVNSFDVYTSGEQGMQTVSLDPDFANNRWVYLYYAPTKMEAPYPEQVPTGNAPATLPAGETEAYWDRWKGYMVLSRLKWDPAAQALDLTTKQDIIKVEHNRGGGNHVAGDVDWDADGNLYLSTGDNTGRGRRQRRRLRADQRLAGAEPGRRRAPRRGQHQRPARQDPAHQGPARRHVHDPAGQPVHARHDGHPGRDLRDGSAQPVPHDGRPPVGHADVGRLRSRRRPGRSRPRADGPGGVERGLDHGRRAQQRLAVLHGRQPQALQQLELRHVHAARVLQLRRDQEHVAQQHRPRRPSAGPARRPSGTATATAGRSRPRTATTRSTPS